MHIGNPKFSLSFTKISRRMKKNFLLLVVSLLMSAQASSQQDDHRLSPSEAAAMPNYLATLRTDGIVTPPTSPVRASAEWEEIDALMVTWVGYTTTLREIVRYAQDQTQVDIICADSNTVISSLNSAGVPLTNVRFVIAPYNSVWSRDYGQWNVYTNDVDSLALIDWIYNRPRPKDDSVPSSIARYENLPIYQTTVAPYNLVHTGGNFMCDGFGTGFSSNLVVNENPGHTVAEIDTIMRRFMGITRYIKMPTLPYDEIHHIDMHLKLLDEETLLVGQYPQGVSDGPQIEANLQYILSNYNSVFGTPYKVVRIPMPPDASGAYPSNNGDYRTYTNAVFVNRTILLPAYQASHDSTAIQIWRNALPGYRVKMINCNQIIAALGALHCITKEVATRNPLLISHQQLANTTNTSSPYQVDARIQHRSGIAAATLYYRTDSLLPYQSVSMSFTNPTANTWTGYIPAQPSGTRVYYYVEAASVSGKTQVRPMSAPAGYWHFDVGQLVAIAPPTPLAQVQMLPAFPNPSKGITCIPVILATPQRGELVLNDLLGRRIAVIEQGEMPAGEKNYFLNAADLPSGIYTLELRVGGQHIVQRWMVK
jgi:agmatine deiminase